jgi:exonuclease III
MTIRIVSWNCNGGLRKKFQHLDALEADILIVQECEDPAQYGSEYLHWAGKYQWCGDIRSKGIGIFSRLDQPLRRLDWDTEPHKLFLPVGIGDDLEIVGVWTQNAKPTSNAYIVQFWNFLQANRDRLSAKTLLCGDFNSNTIWDKPRRIGNHSTCVDELAAIGLVSLYHHSRDEQQGVESEPTFYLYRHAARSFHIDFVFAHADLAAPGSFSLDVGNPGDWLAASDHMPMVADLNLDFCTSRR